MGKNSIKPKKKTKINWWVAGIVIIIVYGFFGLYFIDRPLQGIFIVLALYHLILFLRGGK